MQAKTKNAIVYIVCPGRTRTGGPELLHQLASHLLKRNVDVRMVYHPYDAANPQDTTYEKYHIPCAEKIIDAPENILIAPESHTEFICDPVCGFPKTRKILWWLSVDNWLLNVVLTYAGFYQSGKFLSIPFPKKFCFNSQDNNLIHWVQSEYARQFLLLNQVRETSIRFVSDYLNPVFLHQASQIPIQQKEPYITYNPQKGAEFTQKLISASPELDWRPIQNMTPAEVRDFLAKAMAYIDFGNHPGKDRIPREAAVSGCCIITGKRGAAANHLDIPIPDEFKFDDTAENIPEILSKIQYVLAHFADEHQKFADYRQKIQMEPDAFQKDVDQALGLEPKEQTRIALLQSPIQARKLLEILHRMPQYQPICMLEHQPAQNADIDCLPVFSPEDASFLYLEGRIEKFAILEPTDQEKAHITQMLQSMNIPLKDCLIFSTSD